MYNRQRLALGLTILLSAIVVQQTVQFPWENAFTNSLSNWMHVPTFSVITGTLLWLLPQLKTWKVAALVAAIALLTEGLQIFTERDASGADLLLDGIGCVIALTFLQKFSLQRIVITTLVCALVTLAAPARFLLAYDYQRHAFPFLYNPADMRAHILTDVYADTKTTDKHDWPAYQTHKVLAVTWHKTRWPGIHFAEPIADWHNFTYLVVDVFNPESFAQSLTAGVRHNKQGGTSQYQQQMVKPGSNQLKYALDKLAFTQAKTPANIEHLILYTSEEHAGHHLLFGRVWLE